MKKFLMSVALMSAIAIAVGYMITGSNESEMNMSDLTSTNIEALAVAGCPNGCLCTAGDCDCNGKHPFEEYVYKDQ